jgi:hypothetical protein
MDTSDDRRISITLQFGSHKELLTLERTDDPEVGGTQAPPLKNWQFFK